MSSTQLSRREFWLVTLALTALYATLLLAGGLAAGVLGVRYGLVPGPALTIQLGSAEIIAATNAYPNCNPLEAACMAQSAPAAGSQPRFYSVWVVTSQKVAAAGSSVEQYGGAKVFAMPTGP